MFKFVFWTWTSAWQRQYRQQDTSHWLTCHEWCVRAMTPSKATSGNIKIWWMQCRLSYIEIRPCFNFVFWTWTLPDNINTDNKIPPIDWHTMNDVWRPLVHTRTANTKQNYTFSFNFQTKQNLTCPSGLLSYWQDNPGEPLCS